MNQEQIRSIAERLTTNTALYSAALALPEHSPMRKKAEEFFKERDLFGSSGWCTAEEAEQQITKHQAK